MAPSALHITGDDHADQVLTDDPFALLVGMLLDQQYPMEHAFRGPAKILDRFGTLDPATIARARTWLDRHLGPTQSLLFVTHHAEELPSAITHRLDLAAGRVTRRGPR